MIVPWIDIAIAAWEAGFRGEDLSIAIALAQPESQRHSDAVNHEDPNGGSFGLIQINGIHDPNGSGVAPNFVPTQAWIDKMFNPKENYKAGFGVYMRSGKSFNPWGTYTSGAYLLKWHDPVDVAKVAMDGRDRLSKCQASLASKSKLLVEATEKSEDLAGQLLLITAERDRITAERDRLATSLTDCRAASEVQAEKITELQGKIDNAKSALA